MDKNCINTGMCFMPNEEAHFDVSCGAINSSNQVLATGTEQGVIIIWKINNPEENITKNNQSLKRFKETYEKKHSLKLDPTYLLVSNNNTVAFPVIQVEFAIGGNYNGSLSINEDGSRDFQPVEIGEDVLLSLHEDSTLCIWSLTTYRCLHKIRGPPFPIRNIKVLPDRRFIAVVGDEKINIIDIWNIKLIETLEITSPPKSKVTSLENQVNSKNGEESPSSTSSSEVTESGARIVSTACSCPPIIQTQETKKTPRNSCPLIFVAITTNNEMLLWDLTSSILSHKSKEPCFNGAVKVITEWDSEYEVNVPIFKKVPQTNEKGLNKKRLKHPTLKEYMYELEKEKGKVGVIDNFVFLMVKYRIIIWNYEAHELTRTAEIFSFSDEEFNKCKLKWMGFKLMRTEKGENVLACWLRNGKMRILKVRKPGSKTQFKELKTPKFPKFNYERENVELYVKKEEEGEKVYFMYFEGCVKYTEEGCNSWKRQGTEIKQSNRKEVKFTTLEERNGKLIKIDIYKNGEVKAVEINTFKEEKMTSPNIFMKILKNVGRTWRVRPFIITEGINDYLERFTKISKKGAQIINSTGEYLLVSLEKAVLVYSIQTLKIKLFINACHFSQIVSIHKVYGIKEEENEKDLEEMPSHFATIDREGWMVVYNIDELARSTKKIEETDHIKINIDEESIRGNNQVQDIDYDFTEYIDVTKSNFFIYCKNYKGINKINTKYQLENKIIEKVGIDKKRDLLLVLTSTEVMTWRIASGDYIARFGYLSMYRKAIMSTKEEENQLKTSMSISETLAMMISRDNLGEKQETKITNYKPPLSIFSEKNRKKIEGNMYLTNLTLEFKEENQVKKRKRLCHQERVSDQRVKVRRGRAFVVFKEKRRIIKREKEIRKVKGKLDKEEKEETRTISQGVPVLVFPLELLLSKNNLDLLELSRECSFCYLGVANGTMSIPLKYNFREESLKMIQIRTSTIKRALSIEHCREYKKHLSLNQREDKLKKYNEWPKEESADNEECMSYEEGQCASSEESITFNKYLQTCIFFHKSFLIQNLPVIKEINYVRKVITPREDSEHTCNDNSNNHHNNNNGTNTIDSNNINVIAYSKGVLNEMDIWLLVLIMINAETEERINRAFDYLTAYMRTLNARDLDLLVSRALSQIRIAQSFKLKTRADLPQIHICDCNSRVFTFGTKCGSCHKTMSKFDYHQEVKSPKNINEESSLILLALISVDNYLYSIKNSIRFGLKHYTLASYVVQQLMLKLVQMEENSELFKTNKLQNKVNQINLNNKTFDVKTFLLDVFALGFGVVWDLSTFSKHSILPDQIRYTKYSLLFREDFKSVEGICMDSAYFILYLFHYYHTVPDKCWKKLMLVSCSQNPRLAIDIIGWIVKKRKLGNKPVISAIRLVVEFLDNYNELGFAHLPDFVGIIIKCLDPLDYNIRVKLLKPSTNALFYLVKNVPMVDFHQDTQRFAVGSQSGYIVIYDIRSATKWKMLFGKQSQVDCLSFGSNGGLLAAYYHEVPCFTVWKCSSSGLIGSLLSNTNKEYKSIKLKPIDSLATFNQMRNIKIQYKSTNKWFLHREDGRGYMIST